MQDLGRDISVLEGLTKGRPGPAPRNHTPLPEIAPAGRGINAMAASLVIGAVMLPSLLLGGKLDEVQPLAKSTIEAKLPARQAVETDPLRAMEHVAHAELPRPVVLVLLAPLPLQTLQIAGREVRVSGEQAQIVSAREGLQLAAKAKSKIQASPKLGASKAAAAEQRFSGATNPQRLTARPAVQAAPRTAPVAVKEAPRSIAERESSASPPGLAGRSASDLSPEQVSRALFDIAERAGLVEEGQSRAFQACVLEKIRGNGAEAELFWSLVRLCVR